jgi:Reverse transcriptase (RNA-dependent DNA polymerase)
MVNRRRGFDWLEQLDISLAIKNCHIDIIGDWHRDPWNWPETDWAGGAGSEQLVQRLNGVGTKRVALLDVAKENFVIRPAVVLDPIDRLMFESLTDRISTKLIGEMPPWVYGWRLDRDAPASGHYASRSREWDLYRDHLVTLADHSTCALQTDVVSCFASIPIERLAEQVERLAGTGIVTGRLVDMIRSWGGVAGRAGLPQRCNASSILANLYLRPVDDVLRQYGRQSRGITKALIGRDVAATRWMDDIWLFGRNPGYLRRAQVHMQQVLESIGLHMNAGKTMVLEGDDMRQAAREVEHSGVEAALADDPPDIEPLADLVLRLTTAPAMASPTSIRFATVRMREHELYESTRQLADVAHAMPQGSPHLARLFRDSGQWRDMGTWFDKYQRSHWGRIRWAVSQQATMFPTHQPGPVPVQESFEQTIEGSESISMFTVAAQRLAVWDPDTARALFREAARDIAHPLLRRVVALAALNAGDERAFVRGLLSEFEENAPTLALLEERHFRPFDVSADFEGDAND